MSKRSRSLLSYVAAVVVPFAIVLWVWPSLREPRYEGRGVRSWIRQMPYDDANQSDTQQAMRFFGDRAVPYLVEAMSRPEKWENGWLAKIPRRYLEPVINLAEQREIRSAALWRLQELAYEEIERNELELHPTYPITNWLLDFSRRVLERGVSPPDVFRGLHMFGPKVTNVTSELKLRWTNWNPSMYDWIDVTRLLAETRDPSLVPDLVKVAESGVTNRAHAAVIFALGRCRQTNEAVMRVLRSALASTNVEVSWTAVNACGELGICNVEALEKIEREKDNKTFSKVGPSEGVEAILRWALDPQDTSAIATVTANLSPQAHPRVRITTINLLECAGSRARPFVPELSKIARERDRLFQVAAVRALRSIDPEEAKKVLLSPVGGMTNLQRKP